MNQLLKLGQSCDYNLTILMALTVDTLQFDHAGKVAVGRLVLMNILLVSNRVGSQSSFSIF